MLKLNCCASLETAGYLWKPSTGKSLNLNKFNHNLKAWGRVTLKSGQIIKDYSRHKTFISFDRSYVGCIHEIWKKLPNELVQGCTKNSWLMITKLMINLIIKKGMKIRKVNKRAIKTPGNKYLNNVLYLFESCAFWFLSCWFSASSCATFALSCVFIALSCVFSFSKLVAASPGLPDACHD